MSPRHDSHDNWLDVDMVGQGFFMGTVRYTVLCYFGLRIKYRVNSHKPADTGDQFFMLKSYLL